MKEKKEKTRLKRKKREENFDDEEDVETAKKKKKAGKTAKKKEATNALLLGDFGKASTPKKLNDIEAEIERLSKLAESAPKESEDEDESDACSSSSGSSLGRIAPLPPEAYPEHYGYGSKKGNEGAFKGKRVSGPRNSNVVIPGLAEREKNRPKCETCNLSFTSQAQFEEHLKGKSHRKKAFGSSSGGGGAGDGHRFREVKAPDGPHCKLCRKMFTSLLQKKEHEGGKWHMMRVEGKLPPSNKPYA